MELFQKVQLLLRGMLVIREEEVEKSGEFLLFGGFIRDVFQSFLGFELFALHILAERKQKILILRNGVLCLSEFQRFCDKIEVSGHLKGGDIIVRIFNLEGIEF